MHIAAYLEVLAKAQTVFDLRLLAAAGGRAAAAVGRCLDPDDLAPEGLAPARDNLLSLCGRELGRYAAGQATAYAGFCLAMQGGGLGGSRAAALTARLERARAAHVRAIDRGDQDSLPAWKFLGMLYALDPVVDAAFEDAAAAPYRCCRDITALFLTRRPASGAVAPLHLLGLVAFAAFFSVYHLDFPAFIRLLDRHGRPLAGNAAASPPRVLPPGMSVWQPPAGGFACN